MRNVLGFGLHGILSRAAVVGACALASLATACGSGPHVSSTEGSRDKSAGSDPDQGSVPADPDRAIAEADIVQLDGDRLYAMSKSGTVSIVDVSRPGKLSMLGQATIAGEPFEMYLRGGVLVTMANNGRDASGVRVTSSPRRPTVEEGSGALVTALDVSDAANIREVGSFPVAGEVADSRMVGNVLYLATFENAKCFRCAARPSTIVTSFDVADPTAIVEVDQVAFDSDPTNGFTYTWGSDWKRSVLATPQRLYVGGHAKATASDLQRGLAREGIIDVVDISDPTGRLRPGARLEVAGTILSRWQMDEQDGVLRVVSQRGAGRTANGLAMPEIETFRIASSNTFSRLGAAKLTLPRQEGLRTVRFDQDRAFAITYNQSDPLFAIDLSNPAAPRQRGELKLPGFLFHLELRGDRLLGLGVDRTDRKGSLNVTLVDVKDMDHPRLLARTPFGPPVSEDYAILNYEVPEDQDRIHKAFRILDDGLVVVPYTSARGDGCSSEPNARGGVQLVEWSQDTLTKRALLPMDGNPRRAFASGSEIIAVSDSSVRSFSVKDTNAPRQSADLTIGSCVPRSLPDGTINGRGRLAGNDMMVDDDMRFYGCSTSPGSVPRGGSAWIALGALGLVVTRLRRRN